MPKRRKIASKRKKKYLFHHFFNPASELNAVKDFHSFEHKGIKEENEVCKKNKNYNSPFAPGVIKRYSKSINQKQLGGNNSCIIYNVFNQNAKRLRLYFFNKVFDDDIVSEKESICQRAFLIGQKNQ